ncbi:Tetratricopeptide domain protein [Candidatus Sulfopaludibacter sp. SbA6]|nr:Tetratricopeptide domain protein [Candidatus Sulfopaludibacter sp. SbA6]
MRLFLAFLATVAPWAATAQEPAPDIPLLVKTGNQSYMRGDYEAARQSYATAWEIAQQTPPDNPLRYDILKRLTSVRAAAGEFADADNYLQMAINWRETILGINDPKVADDLLVSVGLCRGMKNYDRAHLILGRAMGIHRVALGPDSTAVADDFSRTAQLFMEQKNAPSAIGSLNTALEIRTKLAGPLDPSLAPDLDRLAGAYITERAYDKAEETYRHALVIRETLLGKDDPDLIATVDGLAYACFGQKKYDEAEPIYQRLIALWIKSLGDEHPMIAMALDKVSVFYADQKKYGQAKEAVDRANAIRAHFLASGLAEAATEQTEEGNKEAALALYRRALAVMDPPNPVYQELRSEIEEIVKNLEHPPKAAKKSPPPSKK